MPKFLIRLHGEHYKIQTEKRNFLFRKRLEWKDVGFYTTRFVESRTADEAIEKAIKIVEAELTERGQSDKNSRVTLDEIQVNEEAFDANAPGSGFVFYFEDEE